jgi:hypothetical protein
MDVTQRVPPKNDQEFDDNGFVVSKSGSSVAGRQRYEGIPEFIVDNLTVLRAMTFKQAKSLGKHSTTGEIEMGQASWLVFLKTLASLCSFPNNFEIFGMFPPSEHRGDHQTFAPTRVHGLFARRELSQDHRQLLQVLQTCAARPSRIDSP